MNEQRERAFRASREAATRSRPTVPAILVRHRAVPPSDSRPPGAQLRRRGEKVSETQRRSLVRLPAVFGGLDLFNFGYYWEAHETWEQIWHAAGRSGPLADFIKGLIKLAAAGVKARERRPEGVRRHALRAAELFSYVAETLPPGQSSYMGLSLRKHCEISTHLASNPVVSRRPPALVSKWFSTSCSCPRATRATISRSGRSWRRSRRLGAAANRRTRR